MDDSIFHPIVVSFKAAFQRPDTEAPTFSKADFQRIIDLLAKKLGNALPQTVAP